MRRVKTTLLAAAVGLAALAACGKPPASEKAEPPSSRVEDPAIGLALAGVPKDFRVERMDDKGIALALVKGEGHLEIVPGEVEKSVNLVAAVQAHKEEILARPGGEYKGGRELVVPAFPGAAYYSRGRYEGEAGTVEETVVFLIHPSKDRIIRVTYTYPAGDDSQARLQDQLFPVVEQLEGMPAPDDAGAAAGETGAGEGSAG